MKVKELIRELERFRQTEDVIVEVNSEDGREEHDVIALRFTLNGVQLETEMKRWTS